MGRGKIAKVENINETGRYNKLTLIYLKDSLETQQCIFFFYFWP